MSRLFLATVAFSCVLAVPASAQDPTRTRSDSSGMEESHDHMMGSWKEMDAFHRVLGATWHPAQKNDLVPLRVRAKELKALADSWAASKPPMMPATCSSDSTRVAVTKIARDTRGLVALLAAEADDPWLVGTLKGIHQSFEQVASRCGHS